MHESLLQDIGLSPNEAKVYTAMLQLGRTSTTKIADVAKLHRTNIYDSVKKLVSKGLVSYVRIKGTTLYEAADPSMLMQMLRDKEQRLKEVLPQLSMQKRFAATVGEAHLYEGVPAFISLLFGILDAYDPILVFGIPKVAVDLMKTKLPHFHHERIKRGIVMKHIYNHDAPERVAILNAMPLTEAKCLPAVFDSNVSTLIYGNKVIMTIWSKPVISVEILNTDVANAYRKYFEIIDASAL